MTNFRFLSASASLLITLLLCADKVSTAEWVGTASENFRTPENWRASNDPENTLTPGAGDVNNTTLWIKNGRNSFLSYTAAEGDTLFHGQLLVGQGTAGEIKVSGGSLTVNREGASPSIIGQIAEGTLTITGGSLTLLSAKRGNSAPWQSSGLGLIIGNEAKGVGLLEVSGGEVNIEGGLQIGASDGTGTLTIGGSGKVSCDGPVLFGAGSNNQVIEFAKGEGVLKITLVGDLLFSLGSQSSSGFVNFSKDSKGRISLHGKDKAYFDQLVNDGRIRIGGQRARAEQFKFRQSDGQGELSLAN